MTTAFSPENIPALRDSGKSVTVLGIPADCSTFHAGTAAIWQTFDGIAGGERLLSLLPPLGDGVQKIVLGADLRQTLQHTLAHFSGKRLLILASGDPLFHGVASVLSAMVPQEEIQIIPAATAFQHAFARLHLPWQDYRFYSVHGSSAALPCRSILRAEGAVIYGDRRRTAVHIASELYRGFSEAADRKAVLVQDLGMDSELVIRGTVKELSERESCSGLSLLILPPDVRGFCPAISLGLPDDHYQHQKQMITHPETRAVLLSKLRLRKGVLWDLGAGSGSVGLEAAGLCEFLQVHAVEKDVLRCGDILKNVRREGLPNYHLHQGRMEELLSELPDPDGIFIGGGGAAVLKQLLPQAFSRLKKNGVLVAVAVLLETESVLTTCELPDLAEKEFLTLNIARAETLGQAGQIRRAENPVFIGVFHKGNVVEGQ